MPFRLSLFLCLLFSAIATFGQHTLTITVTDIRKIDGELLVGLYRGEATWLEESQVYQTLALNVTDKEMTFQFTNLPKGEYGVALLHDRDGDEEMSFNWVGIPVEAYGFSHIESRKMSEPSFEECRIVLSADTRLTIDLVHWL